MLEKLYHLAAAVLLVMLCGMATTAYAPQIITSLGLDLSTVCHRVTEICYPAFYSLIALTECGILLSLVLRRRC